MGQPQSKDELLYEQVIGGNVEAIRALCAEGAGLEWIDKEGKTPLIVACMNPELFIVAKALIELGANINTYRPGHHAGTPLHHAAKRGLYQTVKLLLSSGANSLVMNDDCQTPLDVARQRGFNNVVRAIESHICFFSGWLREFYGPSFLEALAPQLLSRKIWVVILPCGSNNALKPLKLELVMYSTLQDAQPHTVIALWKANIEEPKFHHSDPALIIFEKSTKTRHKLSSANDGDKQQLQCLYDACRGIPQAIPPPVLDDSQASVTATTTQTAVEAAELAMAINASIQSAMEDRSLLHPNNHPSSDVNGWGNSTNATSHNGWGNPTSDTGHNGWWGSFGGSPPTEASSSSGWMDKPGKEEYSGGSSQNRWASFDEPPPPEASSSGWSNEPAKEEYNGWGVLASRSTSNPIGDIQMKDNRSPVVQTTNANLALVSSAPSAPPVSEEVLDEGPIRYPSIDFSPVDMSMDSVEHETTRTSETKDGCVICWEAPVEGACIPCGHMAGCMSCLDEIKTKKGDCPVCRAKIDQVIRLYAV